MGGDDRAGAAGGAGSTRAGDAAHGVNAAISTHLFSRPGHRRRGG
jgi:hypothetical protein